MEAVRFNSATAQERNKKESTERKRSILHLIESYLRNNNLFASAECLAKEAQLVRNVEVCDNVDLDIILQEYQSYYNLKFQKAPKLLRKINEENQDNNYKQKKPTKVSVKQKTIQKSSSSETDDFQFEIINLTEPKTTQTTTNNSNRVHLKPLCDYEGYTTEWRDIAEQIIRETITCNLGVTWNDCIGLNTAKESLKETFVYPKLHPKLFTGLLSPPKAILLFGPPGTGKTLLAKITSSHNPFINVTSSGFVSKWRGESEKMIRVLFDLARYNSPTTIFIDELDAFASGHSETNHEASTRLKSELLVNLDGVLGGGDGVFVLAATNVPWRLDTALLRRFERRILVDVPGRKERKELFEYYLKQNNEKVDYGLEELVGMTEGYSCADIRLVCKEALMEVVRENLRGDTKSGRKMSLEDLKKGTRKIKPCANDELLKKYREWNEKYGYK